MRLRTWLLVVVPAGVAIGLMLGLASAQTGHATPWPHFKQHAKGWMPTCPSGMDLIRHDPKPDCFWGVAPMRQKPTAGDFECVPWIKATKLQTCPVE